MLLRCQAVCAANGRQCSAPAITEVRQRPCCFAHSKAALNHDRHVPLQFCDAPERELSLHAAPGRRCKYRRYSKVYSCYSVTREQAAKMLHTNLRGVIDRELRGDLPTKVVGGRTMHSLRAISDYLHSKRTS